MNLKKIVEICNSILQVYGLQAGLKNRILGWTATPDSHPVMVDFEEDDYVCFHWEEHDMSVRDNLVLQGYIVGQMSILAPDWEVQKDYNKITSSLSFYPKKK